MKISYLVTCKDETNTLRDLLDRVHQAIQVDGCEGDEVVVLIDTDDESGDKINKETGDILREYTGYQGVSWYCHPLNNDYGSHKNFGNEKCQGDYIFQLDGDELPSELTVGENLHAIIESNDGIELIFVPRMNDYTGVQGHHAQQWGWRLSESPSLGRPLINWPDFQGRIYKRVPERIRWDRRLHEKIEGHLSYSFLPIDDESFAMWHRKTIERQIQTNMGYNKRFTQQENLGHKVV